MKKLLTGILSTLALAVLMAVPAFAGTLVFDTAGGTFVAPSATYTKPEDPVRAGHTFTGWVDDDGKAITFNGSDVSGSKTAHATWKVSTYQVRFPSKVKLTGSDLTYGSTINTYTNTEGLSPLAKVSANAVISEFVNDRDPSVRISANQQQTNTVPEIGQQTGEQHYQQNISQQFAYPGNYTASAIYHVDYKEKVNVNITCPEYPSAIASVTGDMTAWPGEEIHLQVAYAIGYDNSSYTKSDVDNWSALGNGKDFQNGLVDTISFKVPENAIGTIEIEATVIAHIFHYSVKHYQEKFTAGQYDLIETTNHTGFAGSYVGIDDYKNTYEGFSAKDENKTLLDGDNKTIICHYTRNSYNITLNGNGGTPSTQTISKKFGETFGGLSASKQGYNLSGWFSDATGGTQFSSASTMPANDMTFYAHWTPRDDTAYKVYHYQQNLNGIGYTLAETQNLTGTTDTSVTPARKSYAGFTAPAGQIITILGNGTASVEYRYTRNKYTLTIGSATGCSTSGSSSSGSYYYGTTITLRASANTGYSWSKWNKGYSQYSTTANTTMTMPAESVTMTPVVTPINYSIAYNVNGGNAISNSSYNITSSVTLPTPTRSGYYFAGWTGNNGSTPQTSVTIPAGSTGDKSYTANWYQCVTLSIPWVPDQIKYIKIKRGSSRWDEYKSVQGGNSGVTIYNIQGNDKILFVTNNATVWVTGGTINDYIEGTCGIGGVSPIAIGGAANTILRCDIPWGTEGYKRMQFNDSWPDPGVPDDNNYLYPGISFSSNDYYNNNPDCFDRNDFGLGE